jgi:uncharacterized protein (TIGR03382 family)
VDPAPGFEHSSATYISPGGIVVGTSTNRGLYTPQPTRWAAVGAPAEALGVSPLGGGGEPYRCSDDGRIVVGRWMVDQNTSTPAMWTGAGTYVPLDGPGTVSEANGVSADGSTLTGWSSTSGGRWMLRWQGRELTNQYGPLFVSGPCSPDGGTALGVTYLGGSAAALSRWTYSGGNGSIQTLTRFPETWTSIRNPTAMTPTGDAAVGWAYTGNNAYQSWLWRDGQLADMGLPEGVATITATGISADAQLVVGTAFVQVAPGVLARRAEVWTSETGWQLMTDWLDSQDISFEGWTFNSLNGVTPDGLTFVGQGLSPLGEVRGFAITIPGPGAATALLLGLGVVGRRRR